MTASLRRVASGHPGGAYGPGPMTSHRSSTGRRRSALATAAAVLLLASSCGGDDDASEVTEPPRPDREETAAEPVADDDDGAATEVPAPEWALDETPAVADGFRQVDARCDAEDERGAWLALAVPEGWELKGAGSAGSGSPLGDSATLEFDTGAGSVKVELEPDRMDAEGNVLGPEGEPWTTFDYEWSSFGDSGEKTGTITFDAVGTVELADQQVELFVAPRDQDPEFLSATQYKARVELARLPNFALDNQLHPASTVIVITHDPDAVELGEDEVTAIVGSLAIPTCTRDRVIGQLEMTIGEDLDGDGHVTSVEDLLGGDLPSIDEILGED